jgi:CRP-like cAMP-binding protein
MAAAPPATGYISIMNNTPSLTLPSIPLPEVEYGLFRQMRETLSQWADFQDTEWEMLRALFRPRRIGKSEYVLKPGETPTEIFFICSGLLRYFYAGGDGFDGRDGKDSNKVFLTEGLFSSPIAGCPLSLDARCGIQALEPTVVLAADAAAFNALYDRHPIFDRMGRKLGEWWLWHKELRARAFQTQDARARYLSFTRVHGDLAQRIPQYHIASYLGITEVSLSRIRRSLARKPSPGTMVRGSLR